MRHSQEIGSSQRTQPSHQTQKKKNTIVFNSYSSYNNFPQYLANNFPEISYKILTARASNPYLLLPRDGNMMMMMMMMMMMTMIIIIIIK